VFAEDRMQLGALVATTRASSPDDAALITLLRLRVSEACHVNTEVMVSEQGHRTWLVIGRKASPGLIRLPVCVARTLDQVRGRVGQVWAAGPVKVT
jgi:hypothetical protein